MYTHMNACFVFCTFFRNVCVQGTKDATRQASSNILVHNKGVLKVIYYYFLTDDSKTARAAKPVQILCTPMTMNHSVNMSTITVNFF